MALGPSFQPSAASSSLEYHVANLFTCGLWFSVGIVAAPRSAASTIDLVQRAYEISLDQRCAQSGMVYIERKNVQNPEWGTRVYPIPVRATSETGEFFIRAAAVLDSDYEVTDRKMTPSERERLVKTFYAAEVSSAVVALLQQADAVLTAARPN